jgi:hypothetical protein
MDKAHDSSVVDGARFRGYAVRGRVTGALFFVGFGTLWFWLGLRAVGHGGWPVVVVLVVAGLLLAGAMWVLRLAAALPAGDVSGDAAERMRRMFVAVNIIQWVSALTAVGILVILHMPEYIAPAIAIIVGLHLFPLAESFHYPPHYVTGSLLLVWSLLSLAIEPRAEVAGVAALGTGAILFASAAWSLSQALRVVRFSS